MERVRKNWLIRLLVFIGGIFSVRLVSYVMHMTTLDKIYKPRDFRKTSHLEIGQDIIDKLPRYCQTIFGRKMDPINLVFIGTEAGLRRAFEKSGWYGAHPPTPLHVAFGFASSLFNRTYRNGPFMPLYISIGTQDLAFQKVMLRGYGRRHHIRIWRTRHVLPGNNRIWVAAATFEQSFKIGIQPPFVYHHMDPNLDWERDYIAGELIEQGNRGAGEHQVNDPIPASKPRRNPHNDSYYSDGKVKVVEIL